MTYSTAELSYAKTCIEKSFRQDGRSRTEYRKMTVATGVIGQANGSARVTLGGTDILCGVKLDTEDLHENDANTGKVVCSVDCTPAALEALSVDPTAALQDYLTTLFSSLALHPQLMILPHRKSWTLNLETIILSSDGGNLHDVLTLAAHSALYDLKIPRTRGVGYQDNRTLDNEELSGMKGLLKGGKAGKKNNEVDFELESYWDQGAPLEGREDLPVCVTLNVIGQECFFDATLLEAEAVPCRMLVAVNGKGNICGVRQEGAQEIEFRRLPELLETASSVGIDLIKSLNAKLEDPSTALPQA